MTTKTLLKIGARFLLLCLIALNTACNPEDTVNDYFEKLGLNRLAILRNDVQPGALILVGKQGPIYADNMFDRLEGESGNEYGINVSNKISEYQAILKSYQGTTDIDGELAVKFIKGLLQVKPEFKLELSNKVSIEMVNAKVRRMKIPTIQKFLGRNESRSFRREILEYLKNDVRPYLVYEVYRTNKLKIVAEGGTDISPDLTVGAVHPLISEGEVSFSYKKTSTSQIEIIGEGYYSFAVRTAQLVPGPSTGSLKLNPTGFIKPEEWGIKSAGTDDRYSAAILGNFKAITLMSRRASPAQ